MKRIHFFYKSISFFSLVILLSSCKKPSLEVFVEYNGAKSEGTTVYLHRTEKDAINGSSFDSAISNGDGFASFDKVWRSGKTIYLTANNASMSTSNCGGNFQYIKLRRGNNETKVLICP